MQCPSVEHLDSEIATENVKNAAGTDEPALALLLKS